MIKEERALMKLKHLRPAFMMSICLVITLLLTIPQTASATDKVSEALYSQGIEIVEKAISDFKKQEAEYRKLYEEEMAKIAELEEQINQLQQERAQASADLNALDSDLDQLRRRLKKLSELPSSYTVLKGDCLWVISGYKKIYDNPYKWVKIYSANKEKINNPDLIYPGQVFKIPRGTIGSGSRPSQYEVMPGDCLWKIAGLDKIYGNPSKWPTIYQANRDQIKDPDTIYPYQILDIPR